jgi:hypothetical protein
MKESIEMMGAIFQLQYVAYRNSHHLSSAPTKGTFAGFCNGPEASPRAASKRDTKAGSDSSDFMISVDVGAQTENSNHRSILQSKMKV